MAAAVSSRDDSSTMELSINKDGKKLAIKVRDTASKREFSNELSKRELQGCNFAATSSLDDIREIIEDAFKPDVTEVTLKIGYQEGSKEAKQDDDEIIEMTGLSDDYSPGDEMVLKITEKIRRRTVDYFVPLEETAQSELESAKELVDALQKKIDGLENDMSDLKEENAGLKGEIGSLKSDFEEKLAALEARIDEKKDGGEDGGGKPVELGAWQSSQSKSNTKCWNHELTAPPPGLFRLDDEKSKVVILKKGLYQICGNASARGTHWTAYVQLNGKEIYYQIQTTPNSNYVGAPFDVSIRCNVNDFIEIRVNVASYDAQKQNNLTIHRLGD